MVPNNISNQPPNPKPCLQPKKKPSKKQGPAITPGDRISPDTPNDVDEQNISPFDHFLNFPHNISNLLPQNVVDPSAGSSGAGHGAANRAEDPSHLLTSMRDLLQVINIVYWFIILTLCQDLFVDELRNWIQEHQITPIKSQKKEGEITSVPMFEWLIFLSHVLDVIAIILNASVAQQPTPTDVELLVSCLKLRM